MGGRRREKRWGETGGVFEEDEGGLTGECGNVRSSMTAKGANFG